MSKFLSNEDYLALLALLEPIGKNKLSEYFFPDPMREARRRARRAVSILKEGS